MSDFDAHTEQAARLASWSPPLPEPPAPEVDRVVELLEAARDELAKAEDRTRRARQLVDQGARLGHRDSMLLRVLLAARTHEADLWAVEVDQLVDEARALGLRVE